MRMLHFDGVDHFAIDVDEVLGRLPLAGNELVLLTGSIVEGVGNAMSDCDVFVIGSALPSIGAVGRYEDAILAAPGRLRYFRDFLPSSQKPIDVDFYAFDEIDAIMERVDHCHHEALRPTPTFRTLLPVETDDVVHALSVAVAVANPKLFPERFAHTRQQFNFIKYRNSVRSYDEFADIVGAWKSADYNTALHNCREYIMTQAAGLSHLCGNTNYKRKWFMCNVRSLAKQEAELSRLLLEWLHADRTTTQAKREGVLAGCEMMEVMFRAATALLNECGCEYNASTALAQIDEEFRPELTTSPLRRQERNYRLRMFTDAAPPLRDHF